ncbi:MAG: hypothetical protein ACI84C_002680 [Flavobacteriales bacterium]|jgi:hypothetical protein
MPKKSKTNVELGKIKYDNSFECGKGTQAQKEYLILIVPELLYYVIG